MIRSWIEQGLLSLAAHREIVFKISVGVLLAGWVAAALGAYLRGRARLAAAALSIQAIGELIAVLGMILAGTLAVAVLKV